MWKLQGNQEAEKALTGEWPELLTNSDCSYQNSSDLELVMGGWIFYPQPPISYKF